MRKSQFEAKSNSTRDSLDYLFFLVSFLAVIIFAMPSLISTLFTQLNPNNPGPLLTFYAQLDLATKIIVPLIIFGVVLGWIGIEIRLTKTATLRLSTFVFLTVLIIEIFLTWIYVYQ